KAPMTACRRRLLTACCADCLRSNPGLLDAFHCHSACRWSRCCGARNPSEPAVACCRWRWRWQSPTAGRSRDTVGDLGDGNHRMLNLLLDVRLAPPLPRHCLAAGCIAALVVRSDTL